MSAIIIENGLVHYEALGRGKPVLFLHGWIGSWRYWMPTMEAVSDRYRTYAFDLWGFGDSDKSSQRYEIDAYVSLVGLFMDELGLVKAPIIGHSLGAVVGTLFAARTPDRVDKLMTVSMPLQSSLINRKLVSGGDGLLDRTIGRKQAQQAYPEVALEADKADPNVVALSARSMAELDLRLEMDKITRPVLMVHGEKDALVAPSSPEAVQDLEQNVRQIVLRDSLHFPMLDEAAKFHRLVRDFLESDLASLVLKDEWKRRSR
jgi:pimeloyl-ACP methyl ester carboxylesterase